MYINFLASVKILDKNCNNKINFLKIIIINLKLRTENNLLLLYKGSLFVKIFTFIIFKNFNFYKFFSF